MKTLLNIGLGLALVCANGTAWAQTSAASQAPQTQTDPWEPFNRAVFRFNDSLDQAVLAPVARGYQEYTPTVVRRGARNFFNNLADVWSTANNLLQFKGRNTAEMTLRVVVNSTMGIYGLFDVATAIGLKRHPEDLGQTLGYWGVGSGPYVVMPIFGPSTLRDGTSFFIETSRDPMLELADGDARTVLPVWRVVERRASLLGAVRVIDEASLDKYTFTRDAYLQLRRNLIWDGNPPDSEDVPGKDPVPGLQDDGALQSGMRFFMIKK